MNFKIKLFISSVRSKKDRKNMRKRYHSQPEIFEKFVDNMIENRKKYNDTGRLNV